MAFEVAEADVNRWLDFKQVSEKKREGNKENIEAMIEEIQKGSMKINDDFTISYDLRNPIGEEIKTIQLQFRGRVKMRDIQTALRGVDSKDLQGWVIAYTAAVTQNPKPLIAQMDSVDFGICQAIVSFFM